MPVSQQQNLQCERAATGGHGNGPVSEAELTIAPGDGMVIISDGVPDMLDGAGADYGLVRLLDDLHELGHLPAAPLTASLMERIYRFSGDMAQTDDVTILTVRRPV